MSCVVYQKYIKFNHARLDRKIYVPLMILNGKQRLSRRSFPKASLAVFYGHNLAERYERRYGKQR